MMFDEAKRLFYLLKAVKHSCCTPTWVARGVHVKVAEAKDELVVEFTTVLPVRPETVWTTRISVMVAVVLQRSIAVRVNVID